MHYLYIVNLYRERESVKVMSSPGCLDMHCTFFHFQGCPLAFLWSLCVPHKRLCKWEGRKDGQGAQYQPRLHHFHGEASPYQFATASRLA
mmetsp:Transcript_78966/g.189589  ORF Transcript_78966/g.189589 Transcript_78966/m.189589 type:complete len:90 (+) Transcript_78966:46-315(+)